MSPALRYISAFVILLSASYAHARQTDNDPAFCNKKWYCEMTKDAEGNVISPEKGSENDFMHFRCDSSFSLSESGILLEGKWSYDNDSRIITLRQHQLNNIPEAFSFHIIDADEGHMVIVAQSGSASQETAYLFTKP